MTILGNDIADSGNVYVLAMRFLGAEQATILQGSSAGLKYLAIFDFMDVCVDRK